MLLLVITALLSEPPTEAVATDNLSQPAVVNSVSSDEPGVEFHAPAMGGTEDGPPGDPERGFELLTGKAYLHADFDHDTVMSLWKVWPKEAREKAAAATPE